MLAVLFHIFWKLIGNSNAYKIYLTDHILFKVRLCYTCGNFDVGDLRSHIYAMDVTHQTKTTWGTSVDCLFHTHINLEKWEYLYFFFLALHYCGFRNYLKYVDNEYEY